MFSERFLPFQATAGCLSLLLGVILLFVTGYHPLADNPQGYEYLAISGVVLIALATLIYVWGGITLITMNYEVADDQAGDSICFTLLVMVMPGFLLVMNRMPDGWHSTAQLFQDIALIAAMSAFMAMYGFGYNDEERAKRSTRELEEGKQNQVREDEETS